ncbi:MAG: phage major tail tube protein [Asticcacaulis sp.]|uniref:phage major tail tube protein n=1 Tax=Asticcacaulis sp. TaxID=1872648 RepID=UPI003F7BE491
MGLPRKLKNMNLFEDGGSMLGVVSEVTPPKLAVKTEDYRGAGMPGPVAIDMGLEKLELSYKTGGLSASAMRIFGAPALDATLHRWVGSYQDDSTGKWTAVEIVTRGRHTTMDMGTAKPGESGDQTTTVSLSYYKLTIDGVDIIEIDMLASIYVVNGVDRYAEMRQILGI